MTTTAPKRMRLAALGLSTALSVGVLAPFIGTSSASAVTCSVASANTSHANAKLAKDTAKLKKAKKNLKKAKHSRKSVKVIKHKRKAVAKISKVVRHDKAARNAAIAAQKKCTTPTVSKPQAQANPLSDLFGQLSSILAGVPGGSSAVPTLDQVQKSLAGIPLSPEALTAALQAAQDSITASLSNIDPTKASLATVLNAILDPLQDSIRAAAGNTGPGADVANVLGNVEQLLTHALGGYDLSLLTDALSGAGAGSIPGLDSIPGLGSLTGLLGLLGGGTGLPGLGSLGLPL